MAVQVKDMAADLLREAAGFFEHLASQNPAIAPQMKQNAEIYSQAADLIEQDPLALLSEQDPRASA